jgi:PBP1b-binding outer membrane lipoprotein LpoB
MKKKMMNKSFLLVFAVLSMFLITACSQPEVPKDNTKPQQIEKPTVNVDQVDQAEQVVIEETGQQNVDEIGKEISGISSADTDLDSSELDDLDSGLEDIVNI